MSIGRMRERLELQSYTRTSDDGGGAALSWSKVATIFAKIEPQSAREGEFGRDNQLREVAKHKITVRYRKDLTHKNRLSQTFVRFDGQQETRIFNIKGVINVDNRFKFLELDCEEGVPT